MNLTTNILTGIALSMDAMSLSFIYGTLGISKKKSLLLSTIVGLYHFIMPIIGNSIGTVFSDKFIEYNNKIIAIIFLFIAIQMLLSLKKENTIKLITGITSIFLFGLSVSIDSLTVGVGIGLASNNIIGSSLVFSTISCGLTLLGIIIGKKIHKNCGNLSIIFGITLLILLSISYFFT